MAIDNAEKRRSVAGMSVGWGVTPNGSKDSQWRQQVAFLYSGIAIFSSGPAFLAAWARYSNVVIGLG